MDCHLDVDDKGKERSVDQELAGDTLLRHSREAVHEVDDEG